MEMHLRQVDVCTAACPQNLSLVGAAEVMIILVRVSAIVTSGFNLTIRACFETFRLNLDTSAMFFVFEHKKYYCLRGGVCKHV